MNPFYRSLIMSLIRHGLTILGGALIARGVLTQADVTQYTEALVPILIGLGGSFYKTYTDRQKLLTAIATPTVETEAEVELVMATGPVPPVTTAKTAVPTIT